MIEGIFVKADIRRMIDSFKSLKARTLTNWKVSVGYEEVEWWGEYIEEKEKEEQEKKQEKLERLIPSVDAYPVISEAKNTIDRLLESKKKKDFTAVHQCLKDLIELNVIHESVILEKKFLDEAIVFLDESALEEIKNSKDYQAFIRRLSELIEKSPPFYKDHLVSFNKKLLAAKEEYQRKEKLEAVNRHIRFGLERDDYNYALYFIKDAHQYLKEQDANKYLKEKTGLIFSGNQCKEAVELTNKISDLEADHKYKEAYQFLKQLHALNPYSTQVNARCQDYENYIFLVEEIPVEKDIDEIPAKIKENINILQKLPSYLRSDVNKKLEGVINNVRKKALAVAKKKRFDPAIALIVAANTIEFDPSRQKQMVAEVDRMIFQAIIYWFVKVLKYIAAAAALIGVIYLLVSGISSCNDKKDIDNYINRAQVLLKENKYEQLKETLNQLSGAVRKVKVIKRIDHIKNLFEQLFINLGTRLDQHEKNEEYDEALKYAEMAKEFAWIGKRFVIKGFPENLPDQWTKGYETLINRLNYKKFFRLGKLDYKNKRYDSALKNLETARSYQSTPAVNELILKAQKGPRIQLLTRNYEHFKNSKDTENALKTLIEIKKLEEVPYKPFDLLIQVSYRNSQGYPEVTLGGITFVFIRGGEFDMGCFNPTDQPLLNDAPLHRVTLSSFWISTTEITNAQFGRRDYDYSNLPVNYISWTSAYGFARRFGRQLELNSNIPTEAQWEYVARNGGKKTIYPWEDEVSCQKANYRECYGAKLKTAASYHYYSNEFGIFDLAGNVREWCRDLYNKDYYLHSPITDPVNTRGVLVRVVRGGSFGDNSMALKTYVRYSMAENSKDIYTGFRIVLENKW
ncbi:MAG: SUMF1/EgtB/PvdO family nonheme iron enzyme [Candidatus Aminicenantes bacterium]|nr:MAG: SUMF1/EgtB/PvdO family nonheme iron enzyme [Candidatus Aminicenantes bacterium]